MSGYRVETLIFDNGERYPILFPSDVVEVISYLSIQWGESKNAVQDQLKSNLKALLVCEKKV